MKPFRHVIIAAVASIVWPAFALAQVDAQLVGYAPPPSTMAPGQTALVTVTMRNSGSVPWDANFRLGSQNPQDNQVWRDGRVYLPEGTIVYPGHEYVFVFEITAPSSPGLYAWEWRMVEELVQWFGDSTPTIWVQVLPSSGSTTTVLLVNGSLEAYPDWMEPWSAEYQTIAATYGVQPVPFHWTDNGLAGVLWPYYSGIAQGAANLGAAINALPTGTVYLVTHSHGGNVALGATQFYTNRPVARLINLATPVNYDIRYSNTPWVNHMCTASSWHDWVQFFGASPYQVYNFLEQSYYGYQYGYLSGEAFINGNYSDAAYYAYLAYDYIMAGYSWFESTKLEFWGWTVPYSGFGHGDMHEPAVWSGLPAACRQ